MNIYFVGAQGTGKSTVMNRLPDRYKKVSGITRNALKTNKLQNNKDADGNTQAIIYRDYKIAMNSNDDSIFERSIIDVLAYTIYQYKIGKVSFSLMMMQMEDTFNYIRKHEDKYVYFPAGLFDIEGDSYRSDDAEYQKEIDDIIRSLLILSGADYVVLSDIGIEERVDKIRQLMSNE